MIIYEAKTTYRKVGETISDPIMGVPQCLEYMKGAFRDHPHQEQVWILTLTALNHIMSRERVAIGTVNRCNIDPAICFRPVIVQGGEGCVVVHNHPNGHNSEPSEADLKAAKMLNKAAKSLKIHLWDFLIIGGSDHYSFNEKGLL